MTANSSGRFLLIWNQVAVVFSEGRMTARGPTVGEFGLITAGYRKIPQDTTGSLKCYNLLVRSESPCRANLHSLFFQYHPLWRFLKNKFYLKSSHSLKALSGTLIIIVSSYILDLFVISLRLIKMSINRTGCELVVAFRKMTIFVKLTNF